MNEIFVGAKVIFQNEIWFVEELPRYSVTGWWVGIVKDHVHRDTLIYNVIMPEGLNEKRRYE